MREADAQTIIEMYEKQWAGQPLGPAATLWRGFLLREDAVIATKALARLAETEHYRPSLSDFAEVVAMFRPEPEWKDSDCDTCGGDRFVVVGLRPAMHSAWTDAHGTELSTDPVYEEMAPCPECNADADTEFTRGGDQTRARKLDPAQVRERMNS